MTTVVKKLDGQGSTPQGLLSIAEGDEGGDDRFDFFHHPANPKNRTDSGPE